MPTPPKGPRLGRSPAHEKLMLANLATSLFQHGRITTTVTKAKRLRPFAEKLITKATKASLHNRREIQKVIRDKDVVHRLLAEIGPHFADRPGGYTRIVRTMPRKGDNAPMAIIELVPERTATAEAEQARGTRFARDAAPAAGGGQQAGAPAQSPAAAAPEHTADTPPGTADSDDTDGTADTTDTAGAGTADEDTAEAADTGESDRDRS